MKREKVVFLGIILVVFYGLLINLPYFHLKEFQGEEGRRIIIAKEMIERKDWIVPTVEGEIYLNKPPLFNWLLAIVFKITGQITEVTARSLSVINSILTAIILSLFWRTINGRGLWFTLPGLIFLSIPDVMDKAIKAEIDMTFTLFVTSSILCWFYLYETKNRPFMAWMLSLVILSLAFLTKGVISLFFFYITVSVYLLYRKKIKELFDPGHLLGITGAVIIFLIWFIPLLERVSLGDLVSAWINEILVRKEPIEEGGFWRHFTDFLYLYITGYFPWIGFIFLLNKERIKNLENVVYFAIIPQIIVFILFSFIPGARVRYLLPFSGLFALLVTAAIQSSKDSRLAERYSGLLGLIFTFSPGLILFIKKPEINLEITSAVGIIFLVLAGGLLFLSRRDFKKGLIFLFLTILAAKITWASIYFPYHNKNHSYYRMAAKKINEVVPKNAGLYDFNLGNPHVIVYLNRRILKINNFEMLQKGDYLLVRKDESLSLPLDMREVLSFRARRMIIGIYIKD